MKNTYGKGKGVCLKDKVEKAKRYRIDLAHCNGEGCCKKYDCYRYWLYNTWLHNKNIKDIPLVISGESALKKGNCTIFLNF